MEPVSTVDPSIQSLKIRFSPRLFKGPPELRAQMGGLVFESSITLFEVRLVRLYVYSIAKV